MTDVGRNFRFQSLRRYRGPQLMLGRTMDMSWLILLKLHTMLIVLYICIRVELNDNSNSERLLFVFIMTRLKPHQARLLTPN